MLARLRRSTFGLVVLVAAGFALCTLAIGAVAYEVTHEALEKQLDHRIAAETAALLGEARHSGLAGMAAAIQRREAARSTASLDYLLVDGSRRPIAGDMIANVPARPGYEEFLSYRSGGRSGVAQAITTQVDGGFLVVAADRADLKEIDRTLTLLFASALAAVLALGIGAAVLIAWITRQRLGRIDNTAIAITGGDLSQRVPRDGSGSEFDRLAQTLNHMLDRMAGLMDNLRQVSSDVAHDLRTPLTRLHNRLDNALIPGDPARQAAEIDAARHEAGELLEIFAALLRIAEIEGMVERLPRQHVDLSALVEQMAETYRPDMEAADHMLLDRIDPAISLNGDRRLLNQAIANLMDNALRHSPAGTRVTLTLRSVADRAILTVSDDGPGVSADDAKRLFQRFARSERARSTPGHGLGLALVSAVAAAHGGEARLVEGGGFTVQISLPLG